MRILIPLLAIALVGCQPVLVRYNFPEVPEEINKPCPELTMVEQTDKLSPVIKSTVTNYGLYHECQAKVDSWIIWYDKNKKTYEKK